jgi:hypothetical protein
MVTCVAHEEGAAPTPDYPLGYEPLPVPAGYQEATRDGPLTLWSAIHEVTRCEDWRALVEYCAEAVWSRHPEAMALERSLDAVVWDSDTSATARDLALRIGALVGIGLLRARPNGPEDVMNWIRMAVVSSGLAVYDTPVIEDRTPQDPKQEPESS